MSRETVVAEAMEAISPELVLVDPELARVARARLESRSDIATIRRAVEAATLLPPPGEQRFDGLRRRVQERLTFVLLAVSVAANGALAGAVVTGNGEGSPSVIRAVAAQGPANQSRQVPTRGVAATTVSRARGGLPVSIPTKSAVERRILALAFRSPKTTLPPQLIDARTGLPKNNLQAICRHERARIFQCVVRAATNPHIHVVVRYRVRITGRGIYSWSRPAVR